MAADPSTDPCQYLEWDSTFFGRRIARMNGQRATAAQADAVLAWCAENHIECLYFLADMDDAETVRVVEARGFALTDVRLTLGLRASDMSRAHRPLGVRAATAADLPALEALARINHTDSRFYYDGHFTPARCDDLYATWIRRSCEGWADAVLVAERGESAVAGYITCHVTKDTPREKRVGSIGLLGVGEASQGQGLGGALIDAALEWFHEQGLEQVEVVTQGRNVRAQRAYQRRGFVSDRAQLWFHRWFPVDVRTV